MDNAVDGYTENAVGVYTENARKVKIYIDMKQAESFMNARVEIHINIMRKVVSQPTTMTSKVVNLDDVVQCEPVKSARVGDKEDSSSYGQYEPVKSARMGDREDSSGYGNGGTEEVLAELTEQLGVFPPARELRGGRVEGRDEVHREGAEGHQVQDGALGGREDEVSEDPEDPHLSTPVSPVYWMATSATNP